MGLTGTESFQGRLRPLLEAEGAEVFAAARSETVPLESGFDPAALGGGSWAVLTSANGVDALFTLLAQRRFDLRRLRCRFAAIGPATAERLAAHGVYADLIPPSPTTAALARALLGRGEAGARVYLLRSPARRAGAFPARSRSVSTCMTLALYTTRPDGRITAAAEAYTALAAIWCSPAAARPRTFSPPAAG